MAEGKTRYHVFLSHNSRDKGAVEPLARKLREEGLNPFLDKWNLVPGEPIEDALIEALENSDSAAIFVGPEGEGPWQSEEMRDILKRAVKSHNEFRAIPVLLPDASAEALERSFLGSRLWVEFKDVDDDDALLRLAKAIQGEAYGDETFKLPDEPAPYRGLERFERIEKPEEDFFFGRDDEVRALVGRLVQDRFVAVVGASGSGKSSLIRAGLTKQLAEELHPGIRRWQTITVEPGGAPFRALAVQVGVAAGIPVAEREDWIEKSVQKWRASADGVRNSIETLFADAKEPLLLFIDQFEELFTHGKKNEESERISRNFVASLEDLWLNGGDRVRIVVAMRADFIDRCLEIGALKEMLQDRTMLIGEVGDNALREIVKEPAARVGAFLQNGLMDRILTDVHDQSGSLPLLEQALYELWRQRRGAWLTHDAYDTSGGVAGALNDQAQGAYKALDDAQKKIADSLFPRLITLGEGVADTRRRVKRNELYPEDIDPAAVNEVIDKLSGKDARILVTTREGGTEEDIGAGEDFVEFTHEALLGNWQHLASLLASERESIRKHRILTTAAEEWDSKPEDERDKFLLRAGQLIIAEQWADEGGYTRLNQLERQFLDKSIRERTAEEVREAKDARRLRILAMGAAVFALVAVVGGFYALQQKSTADDQLVSANLERARSADKDGDRVEALFALVNAYDAAPGGFFGFFEDRRGGSALRLIGAYADRLGTPLHHEGRITSVTFSPDGKRVLTVSDDNTVHLWDVGKGTEFPIPKTSWGEVKTVVFGPEGARVLAVNKDKKLSIWDVKRGTELPAPEVLWDYGSSAVFSPDGKRVLTVSGDNTVHLWDVGKGTEFPIPKTSWGEVKTVVFGPEGARVLAVNKDKKLSIWDVKRGTELPTPEVSWDYGSSAVFSPDGRRVLITSYDNPLRIWDLERGTELPAPEVSWDYGSSAVFSPAGRSVLITSDDNPLRVWDVERGTENSIPKISWGEVKTSFFGPEGVRVLAVNKDKKLSIWDVKRGIELPAPEVSWNNESSAVFSPDGKRVLVKTLPEGWNATERTLGGTVRIWNLDSQVPESFKSLDEAISTLDFRPDGTGVARGSAECAKRPHFLVGVEKDNGSSLSWSAVIWCEGRIWDLEEGAPLVSRVIYLATSLDGMRVLTEESVESTLPQDYSHEQVRVFLAASPDGIRVFTENWGGVDGGDNAQVWNLKTGNLLFALKKVGSTVNSAAFNLDGTRIVTCGGNTRNRPLTPPRVWDAKKGKALFPLEGLDGHKRITIGCDYSPDGTRIFTTSEDGFVRVWNASTGDLADSYNLGGWVGKGEVQYNPNGMLMGIRDKIRDTVTGIPIYSFGGDFVSFSSDGKRFAIEDRNSSERAKVWLLRPPACKDADRLRLSVEIRTGHAWSDKIKRTYVLTYDELKEKQDELSRDHDGKLKFCDAREWEDLSEKELAALRGPGQN